MKRRLSNAVDEEGDLIEEFSESNEYGEDDQDETELYATGAAPRKDSVAKESEASYSSTSSIGRAKGKGRQSGRVDEGGGL